MRRLIPQKDIQFVQAIQDYGIEKHKDFSKLVDGNEYKSKIYARF